MVAIAKQPKPSSSNPTPRPPTTPRPPEWQIWVTAARPHTLTASLCPCLVATASVHPPMTWIVLWMTFCVTIQLGTNLHNDYADGVRGADSVTTRVGPPRVTAMQWWTPTTTATIATMTLLSTALAGLALMAVTDQWTNGWMGLALSSSIFNAFAYTAGPYPLGYIGLGHFSIAYCGLGDVFVFLYFGLVATGMLPYLMYLHDDHLVVGNNGKTDDWVWQQCLYSVQVGLLATNIIVVNNLRDRQTDAVVGKRTTTVRFGRTFSLLQYLVCNVVAYLLVLVDYIMIRFYNNNNNNIMFSREDLVRLAPLLSIGLAVRETKAVWHKEGAALNPHVGGTARVQLAFCVLLATSLYMSLST